MVPACRAGALTVLTQSPSDTTHSVDVDGQRLCCVLRPAEPSRAPPALPVPCGSPTMYTEWSIALQGHTLLPMCPHTCT
jgi:hypothetical protein